MDEEREPRDRATTDDPLPPCGLYRTGQAIEGKVAEGALVYYHNHGDPGPGVYPVKRWLNNKAVFAERGVLTPGDGWAQTLVPLPREGFYKVLEAFYCCERECRRFQPGQLVQLGYNGRAEPLLFLPLWTYDGLSLPRRGTRVALERLELLEPVKVAERFDPVGTAPSEGAEEGGYLH